MKNVDVYIILPPDCTSAISTLLEKRIHVGVPENNPFVFARLHSNTPLSGHTELREVAQACPGLKYPERISSRSLRKYIATVSQASSMLLYSI